MLEEKTRNKLTLIKLLEIEGNNSRRYGLYECECENICTKRVCHVNANATKSCGCLYKQSHNMSNSSEYNTWLSMKQRCLNPNSINYDRYGGRGITICQRWVNSFKNFIDDMGLKPSPEFSIHRIDNDGNYEPENCKWATDKEQARGTSKNIFIEYNGKKQTCSQWQEEVGGNRGVISARINRYNWTPEKAASTPVHPKETLVTFNGKTQSLIEWAAELNINYKTLVGRYVKWGVEKALSEPVGKYNQRFPYNGSFYSLKELSNLLNIPYQKLYHQIIRNNKTVEEIVNG